MKKGNLCEKCQEKETTGPQARFCALCRHENRVANGRRGGKKNAALGLGRIHVASRQEEDES